MSAPVPTLEFTQGTLLLQGVDERFLQQAGNGHPWVWDRRVSAWRCEAYCYRDLVAELRSRVPTLDNQVPRWESVVWPRIEMPVLRPQQQAAIAAWWSDRRGLVIMPTGTGKTEVALSIMQRSELSTLVVAPVRDLMYQWHRRIEQRLGYDAGIVGDQIYRVRPVSVTTYDSACIHMERLGNQFGLIIFDECHHLPGRVRADAARFSAAPARLGLTATLERADGRHADLYPWVGPTVYVLPLSEVRGTSLAEYDVVRIPVHLTNKEQQHYEDLTQEIRHFMHDRRQENESYTWKMACAESGSSPEARRALRAMRQKRAIEDRASEKLRVLEDLFRLHAGTPVLIFAGSNAMAREVSRTFLIPCLLNHCGKKERTDYLDGLANGVYPALVANQVLDEGVDLPEVKVAIVIGGSASTRQSRQRLGRILRKSGNTSAVLYEVVCLETREEDRSRQRRSDRAFQGTRTRRAKTLKTGEMAANRSRETDVADQGDLFF